MAAARKMILDRVIPCAHRLLLLTRSNRGIGNLQQSRNVHGEFVFKKVGHENAAFGLQQQHQMIPSDDDDDDYERRRFMAAQTDTYAPPAVVEPPASDDDFLGANKLGRRFLMRSSIHNKDGKQQQQHLLVPVESLRGKIVGLYFEMPLHSSSPLVEDRVNCAFREFYTALNQTKPDSFEIIYVPPYHELEDEEGPFVHYDAISTLPWLSINARDHHWRSYLHQIYDPSDSSTEVVFIDVRVNKAEVLPRNLVMENINKYGPLFYPFTQERVQQLEAHTLLFGKETSIQAILGSDSRDYLIDRHSNKVPISSLHNKDVLIFHYSSNPYLYERLCLERLLEIYNELQKHNIEVVSINYDYNGGNTNKEKLWKDHLAQIPWLHLPFGDEQIWPLRMTVHKFMKDYSESVLFVKPKGESLLDPYGYQVLTTFGIQAFPFTRRAAAENLVTRAKGLSFKSYVDEARQLGLDFSSLIRNNANGGTEHVSLSTVLEGGKSRGILVFFSSLVNCSRERLKSLIDVYVSQDEFEVIFVSMDKDAQSFDDHFSIMPWLALQKPIERPEHRMLAKSTTNIDFNGYCHLLAFGPDQLLLQAGMVTKSFENCEFPFVSDAESTEHVAYCISESLKLEREADGTHTYDGDGWWRGIDYCDDGFSY